MEDDYFVKLDNNGGVMEIKRDTELQYTIADDTLYKTEYYAGVFEAKSINEAIEKAKQKYFNYISHS